MVFFTCNICGESVKKPSVEKHYQQRCRGKPKSVSCMDCLKDFYGEDYVAHTKCITEAEKYSGQNYVPKESKNTNAKKQESWMDIIRAILDSSEYDLSQSTRNAFQRLQSVDNVPRKKAKFENFVGNCMRMPRPLAAEVWNILEQELEKMKKAKEAELEAKKAAQQQSTKEEQNDKYTATNGHTNGKSIDEVEPPKKKAKRDVKTEAVNKTEETESSPGKFDYIAIVSKIVAKHKEGILLEKLKKKVLKNYVKQFDTENLSDKQAEKFEKKFAKHLHKCATLKVESGLVRAC